MSQNYAFRLQTKTLTCKRKKTHLAKLNETVASTRERRRIDNRLR